MIIGCVGDYPQNIYLLFSVWRSTTNCLLPHIFTSVYICALRLVETSSFLRLLQDPLTEMLSKTLICMSCDVDRIKDEWMRWIVHLSSCATLASKSCLRSFRIKSCLQKQLLFSSLMLDRRVIGWQHLTEISIPSEAEKPIHNFQWRILQPLHTDYV